MLQDSCQPAHPLFGAHGGCGDFRRRRLNSFCDDTGMHGAVEKPWATANASDTMQKRNANLARIVELPDRGHR
jgi:hypothetical protein